MKFLKIFFLLNLIVYLSSCGSLKKGFSNQKKNNNDEFLVEKKAPLVMPPNYDELPVPQSDINQKNSVENEFKKLILEDDEKNINNSNVNENKNFETSIIEKIKKD
mgnify:CR=1 FL=1